MLDQALDALATLADRLGKAIDFSARHDNDTDAGYQLTIDEAVALEETSRREHEAWFDDYQQALNTLATLNYPDEEAWWRLNFSCPQIAFTEAPLLGDGKSGVWVIGSGRPYRDGSGEGTHGPISACEAWPADKLPGVKRVEGYFWDDAVRHWEKVLEGIEGTIRRVSETLFIMRCSLGGLEAERLGELLARVAAERDKRRPGRPRSDTVAERRKEVANMDANGHPPKRILHVLAPNYPGMTSDTIDNDLKWLKKQRKG